MISRSATRSLALSLVSLLGLAFASAQPAPVWGFPAPPGPAANNYTAMAVDGDGFVHIGERDSSVITLLSPDGKLRWSKPVSGSGAAVKVACDAAGNTYVLSVGRLTRLDLFGNVVYSVAAIPLHASFSQSTDLAVLPDGTAYVTGLTRQAAGGKSDVYLFKFGPAGSQHWFRLWDGPSKLDDEPVAVRLHPSGGVTIGVKADYLAASSVDVAHMAVLRYDVNGTLAWSVVNDTAGQDFAEARAMTITPTGDTYVVGDGWTQSGVWLLKVTSTGQTGFFGKYAKNAKAAAVAVDPWGASYVTGQDETSAVMLIKFGPGGGVNWVKSYKGPMGYDDHGLDVQIDQGGKVFVFAWGHISLDSVFPVPMVIKYASDGSMPWPASGGKFFNGGLVLDPGQAGAMVLDRFGSFHVTSIAYTGTWNGWAGKFNEGPRLFSMSFGLPFVMSGGTTDGTAWLSGPAPAGGVNVNLSSGSAALTVTPPSVLIPAGASSASFSVKGVNTTYAPITGNVIADSTIGNVSRPMTVRPSNYAQFVSQSVPTSMTAGQSYPVSIHFKNTGAIAWDTAHGYKLQSKSPHDNLVWGINRLPLVNGPVPPGGTGIFSANVIAPATAGTRPFQWQPLQEGVGNFGPGTPVVNIPVTVAADAAQFVSQSNIEYKEAGWDFTSQITFKNVGTATWTSAAGYRLVSRNPYNNTTWGTNTVALPASVPPGGTITFTQKFTAPIVGGTYGFQWSMIHGGALFGDLSTNQQILVEVAGPSAQFISQSVPVSIPPGQAFTASIVMKNVGYGPWLKNSTTTLRSQSPLDNTNWGIARIPLANDVPVGSTYTFNQVFTAPSTPGNYNFQWRMHMTDPGFIIEGFGQKTPNVVISVQPDAAEFVSKTGAVSVSAGQDFYVQNTMKNTGITTWSDAAGYRMVSQSPLNNFTWGTNFMAMPAGTTVAPGAQVTFTKLCTAPLTPGTYTMQWQMSKSGVPFGQLTPLISITVNPPSDNALFISQANIPTTFPRNQIFVAQITMKNNGITTWTTGYGLAPIQNIWGTSVIPLQGGDVPPGGFTTFNWQFKTPSTPGTYTFQWRMSKNGSKFGQSTAAVTITVT